MGAFRFEYDRPFSMARCACPESFTSMIPDRTYSPRAHVSQYPSSSDPSQPRRPDNQSGISQRTSNSLVGSCTQCHLMGKYLATGDARMGTREFLPGTPERQPPVRLVFNLPRATSVVYLLRGSPKHRLWMLMRKEVVTRAVLYQ